MFNVSANIFRIAKFFGSSDSDFRTTFRALQLTCHVLWDQTTKLYEFLGHDLIAARLPPKLKVFIGILAVLGPN